MSINLRSYEFLNVQTTVTVATTVTSAWCDLDYRFTSDQVRTIAGSGLLEPDAITIQATPDVSANVVVDVTAITSVTNFAYKLDMPFVKVRTLSVLTSGAGGRRVTGVV